MFSSINAIKKLNCVRVVSNSSTSRTFFLSAKEMQVFIISQVKNRDNSAKMNNQSHVMSHTQVGKR